MVAFFGLVTAILFPLVAVLIPSVSAAGVPACGRTCMEQSLSGSGCKSVWGSSTYRDDVSCICTSSNDFVQYTNYMQNFCSGYNMNTLSGTDVGGGATSLDSPPSPGISSTFGGPISPTSPAHKSGAAVPGAKAFSGSNGVFAIILGGIVFGAHVAGLR
ncbi:uncharacterized protein EI90DRAFT_3011197 [Cantharellus anzutake]|uniref:uncharacterized protein n=1 Tax=Cantharellus anzutake TaxID=1750568 RepID=UPI001903948C|nr:uncharacterized protein EI90DRAFT_3011197 [Cantharellus anzutake]KAF8342693.1 hypothetical protein EI90DRAFT_3011197 [Cantharellus anzutake]